LIHDTLAELHAQTKRRAEDLHCVEPVLIPHNSDYLWQRNVMLEIEIQNSWFELFPSFWEGNVEEERRRALLHRDK